jgi:hypothetical protein
MPHWRELQQRLDMKSRAVDRDDAAVSPVEGKKQISAGEKDDLSACAMQLTARFEEEFPLRLGYRACSRDVVCLEVACAVLRRRFPVGERPTRQTLQPEATGATVEVTKRLKPLGDSGSQITVTARVCRP